jgi:hypothetical protein
VFSFPSRKTEQEAVSQTVAIHPNADPVFSCP